MNRELSKIFVAGHKGMVGSALLKELYREGYKNIITRTRHELNLFSQTATDIFFEETRPDLVVIAAAKVGGIIANSTYPADFLTENLSITLNIIQAAQKYDVKRLLFLGSACIYPREAPQPMKEEYLLTSSLEPTNEAYAISKIAGLKLCQYYRSQYGLLFYSAMPNNLYGSGDSYHPYNSHVIPCLIRRFHEAKENKSSSIKIWGTGRPYREFLHVQDCAQAILHLLKLENPPDWTNIGSGEEITIADLANLIKNIVGFNGNIEFDTTKPDGTPRKLLDATQILETGWKPKISLRQGLQESYESFLNELETCSLRC